MPRTVYICDCSTETEITDEAARLGCVIQCQHCKITCAHVLRHDGSRKWIPLEDNIVKGYEVLNRKAKVGLIARK